MNEITVNETDWLEIRNFKNSKQIEITFCGKNIDDVVLSLDQESARKLGETLIAQSQMLELNENLRRQNLV